MALLDFLKRKKETEKASASAKASADKKPVKKTEKVLVKKEKKAEKRPAITEVQKIEKHKKLAKGFSYDLVKEPHISEKATILAESNQYVFKVDANSNKTEIKKSVEGVYGVNVLSVNIIKIPDKKRRIGKTQGFKTGHTKAIVKVREDQKIEIL